MPTLIRRGLFFGLVGGLAAIHLGLVGMIDTFQERELLDMSVVLENGGVALGWLLPALAILLVGNRAAARRMTDTEEASPRLRLAAGAVTGAVAGLALAGLALVSEAGLIGSMFVNARGKLADILWLGLDPVMGCVMLVKGKD